MESNTFSIPGAPSCLLPLAPAIKTNAFERTLPKKQCFSNPGRSQLPATTGPGFQNQYFSKGFEIKINISSIPAAPTEFVRFCVRVPPILRPILRPISRPILRPILHPILRPIFASLCVRFCVRLVRPILRPIFASDFSPYRKSTVSENWIITSATQFQK